MNIVDGVHRCHCKKDFVTRSDFSKEKVLVTGQDADALNKELFTCILMSTSGVAKPTHPRDFLLETLRTPVACTPQDKLFAHNNVNISGNKMRTSQNNDALSPRPLHDL